VADAVCYCVVDLFPSGDGRLAVGGVRVPMLAWNWS
jgi:hypothetical protein